MALAAAVVQSGRWHTPSLVSGIADQGAVPRTVESDQVLTELRGLMQDAVATPANEMANVGGNVYGQTGSAPFGSGALRSNWFVGYQGDIAFAVVELSNPATAPNASAAPLTASFLQNLRAGS